MGPPATAAIAAPVPAPNIPVLAARQPGVVPQADNAIKVPIKNNEIAKRIIVILPQYAHIPNGSCNVCRNIRFHRGGIMAPAIRRQRQRESGGKALRGAAPYSPWRGRLQALAGFHPVWLGVRPYARTGSLRRRRRPPFRRRLRSWRWRPGG